MNIELAHVNPEHLKPYDKNPRTRPQTQIDKIARSITENGFTAPVVIDEDHLILAGHGRVKAALQLKLPHIPAAVVKGWSNDKKRAYIIADNKLAADSEWDFDKLKNELYALDASGFDLTSTGFNEDELSDLLEGIDGGMQIVEEDDIPIPEDNPVSQEGDVWILGSHRLVCGDSTEQASYDALMLNNEKADLLITDPPYNVNYSAGTKNERIIKNDHMADGAFRSFLCAAFRSGDNVMRPGASFYIFHADSEGYNFRGACRDAEWDVRQCLIWCKDSLVLGRQDYQWQHEPCLYGWKGGASHSWFSDRKQTTLLEFDRPKQSAEHPTMKPLPLVEYLIRNSSKNKDIVLDIFGGSGSTLIACQSSNRVCRTIELDPKYCDVIVKRWQNASGGKARREFDDAIFDEL